jgi:20S proteasome subunit beta 1
LICYNYTSLILILLAIANAIARDGSSGGVIRTVVITKDGVEREMTSGDNIPRFRPEF